MTEEEALAAGPAAGEAGSASAEPRSLPVEFTGTGEEYFKIWITNLLLTIVTLGIYSAWAKVRRLQYFYRNTRLDGAVFDYHGRPGAILKGRMIAVVLFYAYNIALEFSFLAGLITAAALVGAMPWLLAQSQRFRLHNSSYRGLRFRFLGGVREAYAVFAVPLLLIFTMLGVLSYMGEESRQGEEPSASLVVVFALVWLVLLAIWPYLHFRFKRYQHANSALGSTRSTFTGHVSSFYGTYAIALVLFIVIAAHGAGLAFISGGRSSIAFFIGMVVIYASLLAFMPIAAARLQNHVWNNTRLGPIGFVSAVSAPRLVWIVLSNLGLIVLTLGFFTPFAAVRAARYKLEAVTVIAGEDLENFVGAASGEVTAIGEGAADLFDVDFAL